MERSLLASATAYSRKLRYSYLFLPGVLAAGFAALAFVVIAVDRLGGSGGVAGIFPAGPPAARTMLSTIAASLITVAGLAFSITIVSLQLVSQQFTPRALRNFLGDRLNQLVAGVFIGVFVYCLILLAFVEEGEQLFVPGLSLALALVLSLVALAMLLVFINHMAHAIQASTITSEIARRTLASVDTLYPDGYGEPAGGDADALVAAWRAEAEPTFVFPSRPGFVEALDDIPTTIGGRGYRIEVLVSPGDFVTEKHPLAAVWTSADADACARALRRAIAVASERDLAQDTAYGVRQLTDIAVKALSPSVNDPTTATTCIGYLQAIFERLASRPWPASVRRFPDRDVTMVMRPDGIGTYAEALVQIGRYAAADARVVDALLRASLRVAEAAAAAGAAEWVAAARRAGLRVADRALAPGSSLDERERERVRALADALAAASTEVATAA